MQTPSFLDSLLLVSTEIFSRSEDPSKSDTKIRIFTFSERYDSFLDLYNAQMYEVLQFERTSSVCDVRVPNWNVQSRDLIYFTDTLI